MDTVWLLHEVTDNPVISLVCYSGNVPSFVNLSNSEPVLVVSIQKSIE